MPRTHTFETPIAIGRAEFVALVSYVIHPGFPGSRVEPPEDASMEITDITLTTTTDKRWAPKCLGCGVKVKEIPDWLFEALSEEFEDEIAEHHDYDDDDGRGDYLRDLQIDREMMEGR